MADMAIRGMANTFLNRQCLLFSYDSSICKMQSVLIVVKERRSRTRKLKHVATLCEHIHPGGCAGFRVVPAG